MTGNIGMVAKQFQSLSAKNSINEARITLSVTWECQLSSNRILVVKLIMKAICLHTQRTKAQH